VTESANLGTPEIQAQLIADALLSADVGFLVWDEDRRYIAVNDAACRLLGTTREDLLGRTVGDRTEDGDEVVAQAVRKQQLSGRLTAEKFDGSGPVHLEYTTFRTRTAGMPFMGSVIWLAPDE
jgi:PAS domain S-box-containing protein